MNTEEQQKSPEQARCAEMIQPTHLTVALHKRLVVVVVLLISAQRKL